VPIPQVALAMVITAAATVMAIRMAGRVYEGAVLRFGPRMKLRQALRRQERARQTEATTAPTS
jgi:hypothetical protein